MRRRRRAAIRAAGDNCRGHVSLIRRSVARRAAVTGVQDDGDKKMSSAVDLVRRVHGRHGFQGPNLRAWTLRVLFGSGYFSAKFRERRRSPGSLCGLYRM